MMIGDIETKDNFKYLSSHGIRAIGALFIKNDKDLEDLVAQVPENLLTGFQLRDIFENTKKLSELRKKIYDVIMFNKRFPKTVNHSFDEFEKRDEETGEKKKVLNIKFDIAKFFTDIGAPECIN